MRRVAVYLSMACAVFLPAAGQVTPAGSTTTAGVVTLGTIEDVTVRPGDTATVVLPVRIAEGYHVQANPASDPFLIPLEVELHLEEPDSLVWWKPVYPAPGTFRLEGTTEDLLTYHGPIGVELLIGASAGARAGERRFNGKLSYQACDNRRCLFPASVPVTFSVAVLEESSGG